MHKTKLTGSTLCALVLLAFVACGSDSSTKDDPDPIADGSVVDGTDNNNAHTQPDGTYHYHGNPMAMFITDCDASGIASPVIGFAADGFPIYGSCFNDNGTVRKATSSYVSIIGLC